MEYRVLIVDSYPLLSRQVEEAMTLKSWEVWRSESGEDGYQDVLSLKPDIVIAYDNLVGIPAKAILFRMHTDRRLLDTVYVMMSSAWRHTSTLEALDVWLDAAFPMREHPDVIIAKLNAIMRPWCRKKPIQMRFPYRPGRKTKKCQKSPVDLGFGILQNL